MQSNFYICWQNYNHVQFYLIIQSGRVYLVVFGIGILEDLSRQKWSHTKRSPGPILSVKISLPVRFCPSNLVCVGPILFVKNGPTCTKIVLPGPPLPGRNGPTRTIQSWKTVLFQEINAISSFDIKTPTRNIFHSRICGQNKT